MTHFRTPKLHSQQGVALFVVIVFVLLSMLLALWASRTSLFNELIVGNDADYQRAFEATQALLQDAELDIRSAEPDSQNTTQDGINCSAGGDICRLGFGGTSNYYKIPGSRENEKVGLLLSNLADSTQHPLGCYKGLCIKREGKQDFWNDSAILSAMAKENIGARYGQFTGANTGTNPILAERSASNKGGWYWIEVMNYIKTDQGGSGLIVSAPVGATSNTEADLLRPNLDPNIAFRITALAYGRKSGTLVVQQQTYIQKRRKD
jgi:type IV pilus assembly protein PilX